jgi:carotenoid cleavage dioxygenase-like enzyme
MPTDTEAAPPPRNYVSGPLAPVPDEITVTDLEVTGELPADLTGRYVRNGPNPIDPDPATQHWFLGTGMLHGVRIEDGRAVWYRNRFVPETAEGGSPNTNVVSMGGRTWAIVEAGIPPVEVTDELDPIGENRFDGTLELSYTAHPHRDPRTGLWHAITYHWTEDAVRYVVNDGARVVHEEVVPVGGRPMVHDTAITPTSVLVFDLPCTFDLEEAMTGTPFPYHWDPEYHARVGVLPLQGSADRIRWVEVPHCYVFHPLNAVDLPDGRVVVDVVTWDRVFDQDRLGPDEGTARFERWTLDPATGTSSIDVIDDRPQEFPRGDERRTGEALRFATTVGGAHAGAGRQPLLRHDLVAGTTVEIDFGPTSAAQEFVHVPRAGSEAEDDAWLMGFVSDRAEDTTDLVVLAADDPTSGPVARVHLPRRVPDGFHGNWLPDPV